MTFGTTSFDVARLADTSGPEGTSTAACLVRVAVHHPGHVLNVMTRRPIVYWLPVYPNYSTRHNLANLVLLGIPLVLGGVGLFSGGAGFWRRSCRPFYLLAGRAIDRVIRTQSHQNR